MSEVTTRGTGHRKEDWIALQFRRVYDDALQDSVPRKMLDLLNQIDEKGERACEGEASGGASGTEGGTDEGGEA